LGYLGSGAKEVYLCRTHGEELHPVTATFWIWRMCEDGGLSQCVNGRPRGRRCIAWVGMFKRLERRMRARVEDMVEIRRVCWS
jgi:hypothetical protein